MLASDWRNPADSLDVDSDLSISPLDVLSVVNRINGDPSQELAPNRPIDANYFDVDGDQRVGPLDVLMLVNYINSRGSGPRILRDVPNKLSDEASIVVNLGQSSGSRLIQLEITPTLAGNNTNFGVNDIVNVFLVDPTDPSKTLLDAGLGGTPLLQLISGAQTQLVAGLATWSGTILTIDASAIHDIDTGVIKVQLLNLNGTASSQVMVRSLSNNLDPSGFESPVFGSAAAFSIAGPTLNTELLSTTTDIVPIFENVRYDKIRGRVDAEVFLVNRGLESIGREAVVLFSSLPSLVGFNSPSGLTANGTPYVSFRDAIPSGGLGPTDRSSRIRVSWSVQSDTAFTIETDVLIGSNNSSPQWSSPDPISIMPGDTQTIQLQAIDPDDDPITFSIRPNGPTPTIRLLAGGRLEVNPTSEQIGTYTIDVIAFDGQTQSVETLGIDVIAKDIKKDRQFIIAGSFVFG